VRRRGRVDQNQKEIVAALREAGARVESLANLGGGVADLLVNYPPWPLTGDLYLLEVKAGPKEPLTPLEREWHVRWPVRIVTSPLEALVAVGAVPAVRLVASDENARGR